MLGFFITIMGIAIHPGLGFVILAGWMLLGGIGKRRAHERAVEAKYRAIAARHAGE